MGIDTGIYVIAAFAVGVLIEALKPLPSYNRAYSGVVALALGAGIGALLAFEGGLGWSSGVISGIAGAASAAGIYSTVAAAREGKRS